MYLKRRRAHPETVFTPNHPSVTQRKRPITGRKQSRLQPSNSPLKFQSTPPLIRVKICTGSMAKNRGNAEIHGVNLITSMRCALPLKRLEHESARAKKIQRVFLPRDSIDSCGKGPLIVVMRCNNPANPHRRSYCANP